MENTTTNGEYIKCFRRQSGVDAILNAYDAINKRINTLTILNSFEGEEEIGSTHLDEILQKMQPFTV
jgi:hypothetical protein